MSLNTDIFLRLANSSRFNKMVIKEEIMNENTPIHKEGLPHCLWEKKIKQTFGENKIDKDKINKEKNDKEKNNGDEILMNVPYVHGTLDRIRIVFRIKCSFRCTLVVGEYYIHVRHHDDVKNVDLFGF